MKYRAFPLFVLAWLLGSGCTTREKIIIPQTDLIYQRIDYRNPSDPMNNYVGFVNVDGSGNTFVELKYRPSRPVYSRQLDGILFLLNRNPLEINGDSGDVYFLNSSGVYNVCENLYPASGSVFGAYHADIVIVTIENKIKIIDPGTCETIRAFSQHHSERIASVNVSDSGEKIIYDTGPQTLEFTGTINIIDVRTGQREKILEKGQNPSISPDEKNIAYISEDGIYVADIDGKNRKIITSINISDYDIRPGLLPTPLWSPDGKLLIYHRCIKQRCWNLTDFSLYKFNLESEMEEKIIDNGLFPVWIK